MAPWNIARAFLISAVVLSPGGVRAATFADDLESGSLSRWSTVNTGSNSSVSSFASGSAHRGSRVFRFLDSNSNGGSRTESETRTTYSGNPATTYVRFWLRIVSSNGGSIIAQIKPPGDVNSMAEIRLNGHSLAVAGFNGSSYATESGAATLNPNEWALVEFAIDVSNASAGRRRLWVNGELVATGATRNYGSARPAQIRMGAPWQDNASYTGEYHFDDVVIDPNPIPSSLQFVAGMGAWTPDDCVPLTVTLRNSVNGNASAAAFPMATSVTVSGVTGGLFSNASCTSAITTIDVPTNATTATAYFKATTTGTATLRASHPDLLLRGTETATFSVQEGRSQNGSACSMGAQCVSGFCSDNVCCGSACDGGACDACSQAAGAATDGACQLLSASTVCRPSGGGCDVAETCTGLSAVCPADTVSPSSVVCRQKAGACDVFEVCDGVSAQCPDDAVESAGLVCSAATATRAAVSCDGQSASCPIPGASGNTGGGSGNGSPQPGDSGVDGVRSQCDGTYCVDQVDISSCSSSKSGAPALELLAGVLGLSALALHRRQRRMGSKVRSRGSRR